MGIGRGNRELALIYSYVRSTVAIIALIWSLDMVRYAEHLCSTAPISFQLWAMEFLILLWSQTLSISEQLYSGTRVRVQKMTKLKQARINIGI